MIVATTNEIAGYKITKVIGPAFGLTVRSRGIGRDITAAFKGLMGGEISEYTEMLEDARKQAMDRMVQNATAMGANAVIAMRFDSGEVGQNMSEIIAYGTAVTIEQV